MSSIIYNILSGHEEAFSMSNKEMSTQTLKFNKGDWLLVSYNAIDFYAAPMPIKSENAEVRLKMYFGVDEH